MAMLSPLPIFDPSEKWMEAGRIKRHNSHINTVAFSPNGDYIASGDQDGFIVVSTITKLKRAWTLETSGGGIRSLKWLPDSADGAALIAASSNGDLNRISLAIGHELTNTRIVFSDTLIGNVPGVVNAMDINEDGSQLVIAFGGTVMALTMGAFRNNNTPGTFSTVHNDARRVVRDVIYISKGVVGISYLTDEKNVLIAFSADVTHQLLWEIEKPVNRPFSHRIGGCAVSPSGVILAASNLNGEVDFYDVKTKKYLWSQKIQQRRLYVSDIRFVTEDFVFTGGGDGILQFVPVDPSKVPTVLGFEDLGPLFQSLAFTWRSGEILIASASTTNAGHSEVILAKHHFLDDSSDLKKKNIALASRDLTPPPPPPSLPRPTPPPPPPPPSIARPVPTQTDMVVLSAREIVIALGIFCGALAAYSFGIGKLGSEIPYYVRLSVGHCARLFFGQVQRRGGFAATTPAPTTPHTPATTAPYTPGATAPAATTTTTTTVVVTKVIHLAATESANNSGKTAFLSGVIDTLGLLSLCVILTVAALVYYGWDLKTLREALGRWRQWAERAFGRGTIVDAQSNEHQATDAHVSSSNVAPAGGHLSLPVVNIADHNTAAPPYSNKNKTQEE